MKNQLVVFLLVLVIAVGFSGAAAALNLNATQTGPTTAKKGEDVILVYNITNNGLEPVYNTKILLKDSNISVGTINPGETKIYNNILHIPTDREFKEQFGINAVISNPYIVGGPPVTFTDSQGVNYVKYMNPIEIELLSEISGLDKAVNSIYNVRYYFENSVNLILVQITNVFNVNNPDNRPENTNNRPNSTLPANEINNTTNMTNKTVNDTLEENTTVYNNTNSNETTGSYETPETPNTEDNQKSQNTENIENNPQSQSESTSNSNTTP